MNKMMQVRQEFGEPFVDVVRGFAAMGYSRSAVAAILDFNLSYFRELLARFDLNDCFKPQAEMRRECKGAGKGWPKGVKRPRDAVYTDDYLLAQVREAPSYYEFRYLKGRVDPSTIQSRFGSWTKARKLAGVPLTKTHRIGACNDN